MKPSLNSCVCVCARVLSQVISSRSTGLKKVSGFTMLSPLTQPGETKIAQLLTLKGGAEVQTHRSGKPDKPVTLHCEQGDKTPPKQGEQDGAAWEQPPYKNIPLCCLELKSVPCMRSLSAYCLWYWKVKDLVLDPYKGTIWSWSRQLWKNNNNNKNKTPAWGSHRASATLAERWVTLQELICLPTFKRGLSASLTTTVSKHPKSCVWNICMGLYPFNIPQDKRTSGLRPHIFNI